jgi:predicted solute-binding protein
VRLLIDDTFVTGTYVTPIVSGWVTPPDKLIVERVAGVTAAEIGADDVALAPSAALLPRQGSHAVAPGIAVVSDDTGAVAMRTPVRPDEIAATPARLLDAGETAEFLARATLQPFYGITPTVWVRDDSAPEAARAEVVIVEGAEALREPEGGFSEDLVRAWFILTSSSFVSHLLLAPREMPPDDLKTVLEFLAAAKAEGLARRREWRPELAEREGISRERSNAFWARQRLAVEEVDRPALLHLLRQGSRGTSNPPPSDVSFVNGE